MREHALHVDPVHLERARNQLMVARIRALERSHATLERAAEELFVHGVVAPPGETLAAIQDLRADEVRAVFAGMLEGTPALAITGRNASTRRARELARVLAG